MDGSVVNRLLVWYDSNGVSVEYGVYFARAFS